MYSLARLLIGLGLVLVAMGALVLLLARIGLPLGRLPGDFAWRGRNTSVYFPLATSILISILLSLILYLVNRFRR